MIKTLTWNRKRALATTFGVLVWFFYAASCSSPFGFSGDSGFVTVDFGGAGSRSLSRALPDGVASIRIDVSSGGTALTSATLSAPSYSATLEVPAGAARRFVASALNALGETLYLGSDTIDVEAGARHELSLEMERLSALVYDGNGAASGSAPATARALPGASLTIESNSGSLAKPGNSFGGWNSAADASGTGYLPGAAYTMTGSDVTLYAVWIPASTEARLSALVVNTLSLSPSFQPDDVSYISSATGASPTVTVTATAMHAAATIQVKVNSGSYQSLASGGTSSALSLDDAAGNNTVSVLVTAEDGSTQDLYTVAISKTVTLTMTLGANGSTITPSGSSEVTPGSATAIDATSLGGFRFKNWTGTGSGSVALPDSASTVITVPPYNVGLTANFEVDVFADGDGSSGDPFVIVDIAQLMLVNSYLDKHFILGATFDLASESNWTPLGSSGTPFSGSFDGNGYNLDNLTINDTFNQDRGLFGYVQGAVIRNVTLNNINFISTYNYAGGLIGTAVGATVVENCYVQGFLGAYQASGGLIGMIDAGSTTSVVECGTDVHITSAYTGMLGGLIGYGQGGSVTRCYAKGDLTGHAAGTQHYSGGLIGWAENMTVTDSYAAGTVEGDDSTAGLIGRNVGASVTRCYSRGGVSSAGGDVSGMIGYNSGTVTDSYYDSTVSGYADDDGRGTPRTTAFMQVPGTYSGWDFATVWDLVASYPFLRWE